MRYFNVFGPRQDPNGAYAAVVPKWIAAMANNDDVWINGDGNTSRDFTFVANVIQVNLLAAITNDEIAINQVYNVAVGERTSLNELFELIRSTLCSEFSHLDNFQPKYRDFRIGDIQHSLADITKAKKLLSYIPTHSIQQGMYETIQWFISHHH